mmetsp:Transcript_14121/g.10183  ORF Transcript_14121/g.10183 Transcript_14121/m.10183 type:complete len:139 (+) Transcript_14121:475-891(+)
MRSPISSNKTVSEDKENLQYQIASSPTVKKMKQDPFKALGYGVNTYFDTLASFIKLFFVFTCLNTLVMLLFHSFDGMKSLSGVTKTASFSVGNLGFSSATCSPINFGVNQNIISCPYGTIDEIYSFGIEPKKDIISDS